MTDNSEHRYISGCGSRVENAGQKAARSYGGGGGAQSQFWTFWDNFNET